MDQVVVSFMGMASMFPGKEQFGGVSIMVIDEHQ
jgi:hypothetical protein